MPAFPRTPAADESLAAPGVPQEWLAPRSPVSVWRGCAFLIVLFSIWTLVSRYKGIYHDAAVYLLQAAAKLDPAPLAGDVFLRFQSQDQFTVFSFISGTVVQAVGPDHAAATLTLFFLAAWYSAGWAIAKELQGPRLALLALAALLLLPGAYGARGVFRYAEPFMTARCLAEALALAAVYAMLTSRRLASVVLAIAALLVHPLMTFPVILVMVTYTLPLRRPIGWIALGALLALGAISGSYLLSLPDPFMSGAWLDIARRRSGYLFTDTWRVHDWEIVAQVTVTLALAVSVLTAGGTRRLLSSALVVSVVGTLLAVFASQVATIEILLQGQPWRWLWIGRVLATITLPLICLTLWRAGPVGRATVLLLTAGWLLGGLGSLREIPPFGVGGLLSLSATLLWHLRGKLSPSFRASLAVLSVSIPLLVGLVFVSFGITAATSRFSFGNDPQWVQRLHDVLGIPGIAMTFCGIAWYFIIATPRIVVGVATAAAATVMLIGAAPVTLDRWTVAYYDSAQRAYFEPWRRAIPRDAEVYWPGAPQAVWLLLGRRSYMSISQGAGSVFSAESSEELLRRAQVLAPIVAPGYWFLDPEAVETRPRDITPNIMRNICTDVSLSFVVANQRFDGAVASGDWPGPGYRNYLYRCADFRAAATA